MKIAALGSLVSLCVASCGLDVVGATVPAGAGVDAGTPRADAGPGLGDPSANPGPATSDGGDAAASDSGAPLVAMLTLAATMPPATLDLEVEGKTSWIHWGRGDKTKVDQKASAINVIPAFGQTAATGSTVLNGYGDNFTSFAWTEGAPTASEPGTKTGVYLDGDHPGFTLSLPVTPSSTVHRFVIYAGMNASKAAFVASLRDEPGVAPVTAAHDTAGLPGDNGYRRLAMEFRVTKPTFLDAKWALTSSGGNVTLAAATLD